MPDDMNLFQTETNGAKLIRLEDGDGWRMVVPPVKEQYSNAQLDDYRGRKRDKFLWVPGTSLALRARFSAGREQLVGTAGFGFWNAPFGPGTGASLRLPQAVWFFFASRASNLPFAPGDAKGNGWFVATIDSTRWTALKWAPFIGPVLLLNQFKPIRRVLWPVVQRDLRISFERLSHPMTAWAQYEIRWQKEGTLFLVNGKPVMTSAMAAQGPLGFVTWIDNQHMTLTARGRAGWGVETVERSQWMEIADIRLDP